MRPAAELAFATVVLLFTAPLGHGKARKYQSGVLIDTGEYDWCHYDCAPFDRPTFFFCVDLNDQILVGRREADWIWAYDSSKMFAFKGKPVSVRYNNHSVWIVRTDGKEMHLSRDHLRDVFLNPKCTAVVHQHWIKEMGRVGRPTSVPASAVLVPQGPPSLFRPEGPHFWISCSLASHASWDVCEMWDEKGVKYKEERCVGTSGRPVPDSDLVVDPLTTKFDYEIHLTNGQILRGLN